MSKKIKEAASLIENIGLVAFGVTNGIGGAYLWCDRPFFAVSLLMLSLIVIVRGGAGLLEAYRGSGR